ncbi:MAG: AAA family ATPase, partial [Saprospiraceae bacterium]|nr:AAA family ATPase [Saprospiraceae bacterium]
MGVKISIKGNKETPEYKDAIALKEIFQSEFKNGEVNGEILIISNATLFGQEVKDIDLIALGKFEKFGKRISAKAKVQIPDGLRKVEELEKEGYKQKEYALSNRKFWVKTLPPERRSVFINNFCFVFETKKHSARDILLKGTTLLVPYRGKFKDVTTQSENQKYALKGFFEDRVNFSPYIQNFIWMRNVSWDSIQELHGNNGQFRGEHNHLPTKFSVELLFQLACIQSTPYMPFNRESGVLKGYTTFGALKARQELDLNEIDSMFDLFERVKKGAGDLSRRKVEMITKKILRGQDYAKSIGEKLIVISGRAGTGKTIKLITIACDLAINQGARSLILTYNHALVSDIHRTLALAEIPDGVDTYTVGIRTLHKFFYELYLGFEIDPNIQVRKDGKKYIKNFVSNYKKHLTTLKEYLDLELIGDKEISELMQTRHEQVGWDYLMIDEAQDWSELEKYLIFKIFGKEKVIIADGVDQLVRSQHKCNWTRALKPNIDFKKTREKKGLRQKVNLVEFLNQLADKLEINWSVDPKKELIGGKVIISTKEYSKELHDRLYKFCSECGNKAYEMMFLVPPSLVEEYEG